MLVLEAFVRFYIPVCYSIRQYFYLSIDLSFYVSIYLTICVLIFKRFFSIFRHSKRCLAIWSWTICVACPSVFGSWSREIYKTPYLRDGAPVINLQSAFPYLFYHISYPFECKDIETTVSDVLSTFLRGGATVKQSLSS